MPELHCCIVLRDGSSLFWPCAGGVLFDEPYLWSCSAFFVHFQIWSNNFNASNGMLSVCPSPYLVFGHIGVGVHHALCPRCAKSRLFSTTGSHGFQGPEFCTPQPLLVHQVFSF